MRRLARGLVPSLHPHWVFMVSLLLPGYARAVRYGDVIDPSEFPAVGMVTVLNEGVGHTTLGTAVLVRPDIIVTAAHVVDSAATPHHIKFSLDGQKHYASGIAWSTTNEYHAADPRSPSGFIRNQDIAVVKLNRVFSLDSYPTLEPETLAPGDKLTVVGYGLDASGKIHGRRSGVLMFRKVLQDQCLLCVPGTEKNQMSDSGDSGGPILVQRNNQVSPSIVGIVQGKFISVDDEIRDPLYDAIDMGIYVPIRLHVRWLEATLERFEKVPSPELPRFIPPSSPRGLGPLSSDQVVAMIEKGEGPDELLRMLLLKGLSEPYTDQLETTLHEGDVPEHLLARIQSYCRSPLTSSQLLVLRRAKTPYHSMLKMVWSNGGLAHPLTKLQEKQLQSAGFPPKLLSQLNRNF